MSGAGTSHTKMYEWFVARPGETHAPREVAEALGLDSKRASVSLHTMAHRQQDRYPGFQHVGHSRYRYLPTEGGPIVIVATEGDDTLILRTEDGRLWVARPLQTQLSP